MSTVNEGEVRLIDLIDILIRNFWLIFLFVALFAGGGVYIALNSEKVYRSSVLVEVVGAKEDALGGVASLVGLGGGKGAPVERALAILQSRRLGQEFISRNDVAKYLFPKAWDEATGWESKPTDNRVFAHFQRVLSVDVNGDSKHITVSFDFRDPQLTAIWANGLVALANKFMRDEALRHAETSLAHLQQELINTRELEARKAIFNLMETHIRNKSLATVKEDFGFRVLDDATPPDLTNPIKPNKKFIVIAFTLMGFVLAVGLIFVFVFFRFYFKMRREERA